jgi:hypothetical protein
VPLVLLVTGALVGASLLSATTAAADGREFIGPWTREAVLIDRPALDGILMPPTAPTARTAEAAAHGSPWAMSGVAFAMDHEPNLVLVLVLSMATMTVSLSLSAGLTLADWFHVPSPVARRWEGALEEPDRVLVDRCRLLTDAASRQWHQAEALVLALDHQLPLKTLLMNELTLISRRLGATPALNPASGNALTVGHVDRYWRVLARDLQRSVSDLTRIIAVAEASLASFGGGASEARMPTSRDEALFILGAHAAIDDETLKRLIRALRQCWHPDFARDDQDRRMRETRIRQINVAYDILLASQPNASVV